MLYKDYITVEQDFIPVFSSSSDRTHPEKWKSFYPHESFKKILTLTVETLEKSSATKDRPIWMNGSYGTGKTFASFVIKHILEDPLDEVEKYFARHEMNSLWQRVAAIRRKGKILVVHQSSSAGINSQNKLLNTITDSVKRALRENNCAYNGAASMSEKILSTLKDPDSTFNFRGAFQKYRVRFLDYSSPEEVVSDLETLEGRDKLDLLEDIVDVADKESYNWSVSVQDVIEWLADVREKNQLYAVFFIWDEFTEYFRNNLNNITGVQELAQNAAELSFYLFLITHSEAGQLITDNSQRKIIEARFKISRIDLAESTAFQLMAQTLRIEPDLKGEWDNTVLELWENVRSDVANFIIERDEHIALNDLKNLLPIHPYAAYLLKSIAQNISSNHRTMFQFLCADNEGSFKTFIENHGSKHGDDNYLTADFLWDYFFREDNPDLDKVFQEAMSYYGNFAPSCQNDNQRRVLKVTLILFALQQKNFGGRGGANSLLRSTLKNICISFVGTPLENEVRQTLNYFTDRGIISALEEADDTLYLMANTQIDPERMKNSLERARRERSFDAVIKDENYGVLTKFKLSDYLKYRLDVQIISPTKFLQTGTANFRLADNQIATFYIFAVDEEEQGKVRQTIQRLREKFPERCIIADFSGTPFTRQRYDKFLQNKARELYFMDIPNQAGQVRLAKKNAADLVEEWSNQLAMAKILVYDSDAEPTQVSGEGNFLRRLKDLNDKFFGSGLEKISVNDKLFQPNTITENVAKLALGGEHVKGSFSWLNFIGDPFRQLVKQSGEEYWLTNPAHPISKMKLLVEGVIENGLATRNEVGFEEIWHALKKPPVGLLKCPGSVFMMTLLLKDYADKNFYVRDFNDNTSSLTGERLCNFVASTIKDLPQSRDKFLVRQTPEHMKFCRMTAEIFDVPAKNINSVEDAAKNIKLRLAQSRYPIWSLKFFVKKNYRDDSQQKICLQLLDLFDEFINPQNGRDITRIADEIFSVCDRAPFAVDELRTIVRDENFKLGMTDYIAQYNPLLKKIIGQLKLPDDEYLARLNEKLSADSAYLWKIDDVNRQIDNLFDELILIAAINSVLPAPQKKLSDACRSLIDKLNKIRIPRPIVEEFQPALRESFQLFVALNNGSEKNFSQAAEQINRSAQMFTDFFENQFKFFTKALREYVDGKINSNTAEKLFRDADAGIFFKTIDDFILQMKSSLQKFRQDEKTVKFFATWLEVTGTKSPAEWSNKNQIPILCAFQDCLEEAQSYFPLLNKSVQMSNEKTLDAALKFIRGDKLARISDKKSCEQMFLNYFCGEDFSVVTTVEDLRKVLRRTLGKDVYSWFAKKDNCVVKLRSVADKNYREKFLSVVREKIHELTAEEAQRYLEELIEKDTLLGIRVLKNS